MMYPPITPVMVTAQQVPFYAEPDETSQVVGGARMKEVVPVLHSQGPWLLTVANFEAAWLQADWVAEVEQDSPDQYFKDQQVINDAFEERADQTEEGEPVKTETRSYLEMAEGYGMAVMPETTEELFVQAYAELIYAYEPNAELLGTYRHLMQVFSPDSLVELEDYITIPTEVEAGEKTGEGPMLPEQRERAQKSGETDVSAGQRAEQANAPGAAGGNARQEPTPLGTMAEVSPVILALAEQSWGGDLADVEVVEDASLVAQGRRGAVSDGQTIRLAPGAARDIHVLLEELCHIVQHRNAASGAGSERAPRDEGALEAEAKQAVENAICVRPFEIVGVASRELHDDGQATETPDEQADEESPRVFRAVVAGHALKPGSTTEIDLYDANETIAVFFQEEVDGQWQTADAPEHYISSIVRVDLRAYFGDLERSERLGQMDDARGVSFTVRHVSMLDSVLNDRDLTALRVVVSGYPDADVRSKPWGSALLHVRDEAFRTERLRQARESGGYDARQDLIDYEIATQMALRNEGDIPESRTDLDELSHSEGLQLIGVDAWWSPDLGDPIPLCISYGHRPGPDGRPEYVVQDRSGIVSRFKVTSYPYQFGLVAVDDLFDWMHDAIEVYPDGRLSVDIRADAELPDGAKETPGSTRWLECKGEWLEQRQANLDGLLEEGLNYVNDAIGTVPLVGDAWDLLTVGVGELTGRTLLGTRYDPSMKYFLLVALIPGMSAGIAKTLADVRAGRNVDELLAGLEAAGKPMTRADLEDRLSALDSLDMGKLDRMSKELDQARASGDVATMKRVADEFVGELSAARGAVGQVGDDVVAQVRQALPPDYRHVPIEVDGGLGPESVVVAYKANSHGVVDFDSVVVRVGTSPKASYVQIHGVVLDELKRYSGLLGNVRRFIDWIASRLEGVPAAKFGKREKELELEQRKLEQLASDLEDDLLAAQGKPLHEVEALLLDRQYVHEQLDDVRRRLDQTLGDEAGLGEIAIRKGFGATAEANRRVAVEMGYPEPLAGHYYQAQDGGSWFKHVVQDGTDADASELLRGPDGRTPVKVGDEVTVNGEVRKIETEEDRYLPRRQRKSRKVKGDTSEDRISDVMNTVVGNEGSSFYAFRLMLVRMGIDASDEVLKARLAALDVLKQGRRTTLNDWTLDQVRHELKDSFKPALFEKLGVEWSRSGRGKPVVKPTSMSDADAHAALLKALGADATEVTDAIKKGERLNMKDLGTIGETWYEARYLSRKQGESYAQVSVEQGKHGTWPKSNADSPDVDLPSMKRELDFVHEDGTIVEVKSGELSVQKSQTSDADKSQYDEYRQLVGQEVTVKGDGGVSQEICVKSLRYVFLTPEGGASNVVWMWSDIRRGPTLSVECFASGGVSRHIDQGTVEDLMLEGWDATTLASYLRTGEPEWPL